MVEFERREASSGSADIDVAMAFEMGGLKILAGLCCAV